MAWLAPHCATRADYWSKIDRGWLAVDPPEQLLTPDVRLNYSIRWEERVVQQVVNEYQRVREYGHHVGMQWGNSKLVKAQLSGHYLYVHFAEGDMALTIAVSARIVADRVVLTAERGWLSHTLTPQDAKAIAEWEAGQEDAIDDRTAAQIYLRGRVNTAYVCQSLCQADERRDEYAPELWLQLPARFSKEAREPANLSTIFKAVELRETAADSARFEQVGASIAKVALAELAPHTLPSDEPARVDFETTDPDKLLQTEAWRARINGKRMRFLRDPNGIRLFRAPERTVYSVKPYKRNEGIVLVFDDDVASEARVGDHVVTTSTQDAGHR